MAERMASAVLWQEIATNSPVFERVSFKVLALWLDFSTNLSIQTLRLALTLCCFYQYL